MLSACDLVDPLAVNLLGSELQLEALARARADFGRLGNPESLLQLGPDLSEMGFDRGFSDMCVNWARSRPARWPTAGRSAVGPAIADQKSGLSAFGILYSNRCLLPSAQTSST